MMLKAVEVLCLCVLGCAAVLATTGCTLKVTPAQGVQAGGDLVILARRDAASSDAIRWPVRVTHGLPAFRGGNVFDQYFKMGKAAQRATRDLYAHTLRLDDGNRATFELQPRSAVIGNAWVRWFGSDYPKVDTGAGDGGGSVSIGRSGSIEVCTWSPDAPPDASGIPESVADSAWLEQAEKFAASASFSQEFALNVPDVGPGNAARGVAIVLAPLSERNLLDPVYEQLASRGWATLVQRRITFRLPHKPAANAEQDDRPVEIDQRAEEMARQLDRNLADQAYAVEAALEHFRRMRPDVIRQDTPVVLVGFSLGAIVGPTTAARLGERLRAAVLVAGGALAGPVLVSSGVFRNADGMPAFRVPEREMPAYELDYVSASRLDAFYTAPTLARLPVLQIDASADGTVRPRYADLLWERLGKPERWTTSGGHTWLFLTMDGLAPRIVDWMERTTSGPGTATMLSP